MWRRQRAPRFQPSMSMRTGFNTVVSGGRNRTISEADTAPSRRWQRSDPSRALSAGTIPPARPTPDFGQQGEAECGWPASPYVALEPLRATPPCRPLVTAAYSRLGGGGDARRAAPDAPDLGLQHGPEHRASALEATARPVGIGQPDASGEMLGAASSRPVPVVACRTTWRPDIEPRHAARTCSPPAPHDEIMAAQCAGPHGFVRTLDRGLILISTGSAAVAPSPSVYVLLAHTLGDHPRHLGARRVVDAAQVVAGVVQSGGMLEAAISPTGAQPVASVEVALRAGAAQHPYQRTTHRRTSSQPPTTPHPTTGLC